jgi:hypothetical protein
MFGPEQAYGPYEYRRSLTAWQCDDGIDVEYSCDFEIGYYLNRYNSFSRCLFCQMMQREIYVKTVRITSRRTIIALGLKWDGIGT